MQETEDHPSSEPTRATTAKSPGSGCEILTWDQKEGAYQPRTLDGPKALQHELEQLHSGTPALSTPGSPSAGASRSPRKPIVIIHGLPQEFLDVLLGETLAIEPRFLEAHAGRRGYRPLFPRPSSVTGGHEQSFTNLIYPELIQAEPPSRIRIRGRPGLPFEERQGRLTTRDEQKVDLLGGPICKYLLEDPEDMRAVALCRLSFWATTWVDVIFLDRQVWEDAGKSLRKANMTEHSVTKPFKLVAASPPLFSSQWWDVILQEGDEAPSLRTLLGQALEFKASVGHEVAPLRDVLTELVYEHWLRMVEVLAQDNSGSEASIARLLKHAQGNEDVVRGLFRTCRIATSGSDRIDATMDLRSWEALSKRLVWRLLRGPTDIETVQTRSESSSSRTTKTSPVNNNNADDFTATSKHASEQALDRVTYLGAILLPVSVVSGMLSMNDSFQPGARLFWVLWAMSLPLIIFTVLVILIDKERVTEVWMYVPTGQNEEADNASEASSVALTGGASAHSSLEDEDDHVIHIGDQAGQRPTNIQLPPPPPLGMAMPPAMGLGPLPPRPYVHVPPHMPPPATWMPPPRPRPTLQRSSSAPELGTEPAPIPEPNRTQINRSEQLWRQPPPILDFYRVSPTRKRGRPPARTFTGFLHGRTGTAARPGNAADDKQGQAREWRRQQLGWSGAVSSVLGFRKPIRVTPEGALSVEAGSSGSGRSSF